MANGPKELKDALLNLAGALRDTVRALEVLSDTLALARARVSYEQAGRPLGEGDAALRLWLLFETHTTAN